jgi:hypothetical protein
MKELSSTGRMLPVSTARRGDTSFVLFENHLNMAKLITTVYSSKKTSVADPGCLSRSRIQIFYPSRIPDLGSWNPDPKTSTKERGEKN